jgi:DNA-directed RNA polymerase specialized sigma24 family protein
MVHLEHKPSSGILTMTATGTAVVIAGAELTSRQPRRTDMADMADMQGSKKQADADQQPAVTDLEPVMLSASAALPTDRLVDVVRWRRWYHSGRGASRMQRWSDQHRALAGWRQTATDRAQAIPDQTSRCETVRFEAPLSSPETDAMQAALVSLTQAGDTDAAVALLVQLRPGLVRLVRQLTAARSWSTKDAVEEVRAVFFEVLVCHPLHRRPSRIAANLLLDTRQRLHRGLRQPQGSLQSAPGPPLQTYHDIHAHSPVLAYETIRAAAGRLPGSPASQRLTADLGFRAWVLGQPRSDIARELELGPASVRSRLHRFRSAIRSDYDLQFEYGRTA